MTTLALSLNGIGLPGVSGNVIERSGAIMRAITGFKATLAAGTVALALFAAAPVQATEVGITSLVGNDLIDWAQLGPATTVLSSPQNVVSGGGLNAVVSSAGKVFERVDQSNGWGGNFPNG